MKPHFAKIRQPFQVLAEKLTLVQLLIAWIVASLILSAFILLKFSFVGATWIVTLDIAFYFIAFYVMPTVIFFRLTPFFSSSDEQVKKKRWRSLGKVLLFFSIFLFWIYSTIVFRWFPDYLTCAVPIITLIAVYYRFNLKLKIRKKAILTILTLGCLIALMLPYISAQEGYTLFLDNATSANNKMVFVSDGSMELTGDGYIVHNLVRGIFQDHKDFNKFLMSGAGGCGETSMLEQNAFNKLGYESMKVEFPGEDHAFVEVKINSTWLVIDPGYGMNLVTTSYRAQARINEVGTISYVDGFCSNGTLVELTQDYIPTDTIVIQVTRGTNPVVNASINLVHQLRYGTSSYAVDLPGNGYAFHTDSNGTITIHLGKICQDAYNSYFCKTDPFYKVYVNGQPTVYTVNSTGTGLSDFLSVDLAKR